MSDEIEKPRPSSVPHGWTPIVVPCALTLCAIIYGSWTVIAKSALHQHGVCPLVLAFYRTLCGSSLMFVMHRFLERDAGDEPGPRSCSIFRVPRADLLRFLGLGLLLSLNVGGNILALKVLSPITVAIFQPVIPVVAGITAAVLGIEDLSFLKAFGILCATGGAVVVVIFSPSHRHEGHDLSIARDGNGFASGIPCLLVNVFGGAWYCVFQKGVLKRYPPIVTAASSFSVAACFVFIGAVVSVGFEGTAWRLGGSHKAFLALAYAVVLTTALNYSLMSWANSKSTPTTVTSFMTLQPISAAILACIFLHEVITWGEIAGGLGIAVGLISFVLSKPMEANASEPGEALPLVPGKGALSGLKTVKH